MRAYIAVGSNLGNRWEHFATAEDFVRRIPETQILRQSPVYETDPVGGPAQGKYLNAVWELETSLEAEALLRELLRIEAWMGRERSERNAPRLIDLDLLFIGDTVLDEPGLHVPHPRLHERGFVLKPLMDLDPGFRHPKLGKTIREMWEALGHA